MSGKRAQDSVDERFVDERGNIHYLKDELARGGQGVVYRTGDPDLAIKQPLDGNGNPDTSTDVRSTFSRVRTLCLPKDIPISLPLVILRDKPGYVMKLLDGMKSFGGFFLDGVQREELTSKEFPEWLTGIPDRKFAQDLLYYAQTGATRSRLYALYKCAAILARLHNSGIVYGDVSVNNVFIDENIFKGDGFPCRCSLIDADNLRLEIKTGGRTVYTPHLGAPEIVQGKDASRPRTDCWAFSVMAFQMLALCHPFIGKKVLEPDDDAGWDADPPADGMPADPDEQAYAGYLPFVDDQDDDSNALPGGGLPRMLVLTPQLQKLFQATLGIGRVRPHQRPSMMFWANELARAFDCSIVCPSCGMSYFSTPDFENCPYCQRQRPSFVIAKTKRGRMNLLGRGNGTFEATLPHRLFQPFSLAEGDNSEYEVEVDLVRKRVLPVRGTRKFPDDLEFEFINEGEMVASETEDGK